MVRFRAYDAVRFGCGSLRTHWATRTSSVRTPVRSELHIGENDIAGPEGIGGQIWTIVPGWRRKIRLALDGTFGVRDPSRADSVVHPVQSEERLFHQVYGAGRAVERLSAPGRSTRCVDNKSETVGPKTSLK